MHPAFHVIHTFIKSTGVLALPVLAFLCFGNAAQAGDLIVKVVNLAVSNGHMEAALYNEPAQFPRGKRFRGLRVTVKGQAVQFVFKGLTVGKHYAVAVFHDENDNKKFDQAFLGFPLEGFGFSRDASVMTGAPIFKDSVFQMKGNKMEITVKLKHSVFD